MSSSETGIDLSIITISYNTKKITIDCLSSIIKHTKDISYEIIVIDNGSTDGSVAELTKFSKTHQQVVFVNAGENLGFGKGNNLGVSQARGEYLLFLNSDTLLFDNALKHSLDNLKKNPHVGAYSCRLLNADRSFQPSGGYFPNLVSLFAWQLFIDDLPLIGDLMPSFHPKYGRYQKEPKMDWITGAFMMIKKDLFNATGGFDQNIFMYTEEMELCYRLSQMGHPTLYTNSPAIIHLGGASGGSFLALTMEVKNMLYFWQKHRPAWELPLARLAFVLGSLLRLLIFGMIKGNEKARRTYIHAFRLAI